MARAIKQIQNEIIENLTTNLNLSRSSAAEWRLWTYVVALAIHSFEIILDMFRSEIESEITKTRPGTQQWYIYMCYQFQNGHQLESVGGALRYAIEDNASKIVAIASVVAVNGTLVFKVAKSAGGRLAALSAEERSNFSNYIEAIAMAGTKVSIVSKEADSIRYNIDIYYDPAYPQLTIDNSIKKSLASFNSDMNFNGVVYSQRLMDAVLDTPGVITAKLVKLERKGVTDSNYINIDVSAELDAGYYNFTTDSVLTLKTIKELRL